MEQKDKRKFFGDKIKSFGEGVASKSFGKYINQPMVYEQLARML